MARPTLEKYIYAPLPSSRSIRLIIQAKTPSATSGQLSIDILQTTLDEIPPWRSYTALSYVWGQDHSLTEVECRGKVLQITENLYQALTKVWQITPDQEIWADAVCINQNNNLEKSSQVQIMGEIYRKANSVLIWLGNPNSGSNLDWTNPTIRRQDQLRYFVEGLITSTWLRRMWTLQEVILSSKATVMYGEHWIDWHYLIETLLSTTRKVDGANTIRSEVRFIEQNRLQVMLPKTLANLSSHKSSIQELVLEDLIIETRARECQNPRDKIYALLAIFSNKSYNFSPVDYAQPPWIVFAHATAMSLMVNHRIGLLHISGLTHVKQPDKPSWVPDLASATLLDVAKSNVGRTFDRIISASRSSVDNWFDWDRQVPEILRTRAWVIGVIKESSEFDRRTRLNRPTQYELLAFPSCVELSQGLKGIRNEKSLYSGEIQVHPPKRLTTIFAKDVLSELNKHLADGCQCSEKTHDAETYPWRLSSNLILENDLACRLEPRDWICEIPLDGGLCVLRPSPSGQFQLVGTAPNLGHMARTIRTGLIYGPNDGKRRHFGHFINPTGLVSFDVI